MKDVRWLRLLLVLLLCIFSVSCSSTRIHLNTRYMTEQQAAQITGVLNDAGFEVLPNTFRYPVSIYQSTLLYSPLVQDKNAVNKIVSTLADINWSVPAIRLFMANNHMFKKDSIGLFLLPEGIAPPSRTAMQDLANRYTSKQTSHNLTLVFGETGDYTIERQSKNDREIQFKGKWRVKGYPYLELSTEDKEWFYYFEVQKYTDTDKIGDIDVIELVPLDTYPFCPDCRFVFGLRM